MSRPIVLMDGGMGQELVRRSSHEPTPLWSARILMDEPDLVEAVHRDYVAAGAKVLIVNSYSATPERLARDGDVAWFEELQAKAIEVARRAAGPDTVIAGCLPPLFGSYHPEHAPDFDACLARYREIVAEQAGKVDVVAGETLGSRREAVAATRACVEAGVPIWCGITVDDGDGTKLRSGEDVADVAAAVADAGAEAVCVNCSRPEAVGTAIGIIAATVGDRVAVGGWANGFVDAGADLAIGGTVDAMAVRRDLGPEPYADHAMEWIAAGATIVGGCCEVGPAHIGHLAARLSAAGHDIVGRLP